MFQGSIKKLPNILVIVSMVFCVLFFAGCGGGGGCTKLDSNGMPLVGGALDYDKCKKAAQENKRCTSGGVWYEYSNSPGIGDCKCYATPCEEE